MFRFLFAVLLICTVSEVNAQGYDGPTPPAIRLRMFEQCEDRVLRMRLAESRPFKSRATTEEGFYSDLVEHMREGDRIAGYHFVRCLRAMRTGSEETSVSDFKKIGRPQ